MNIYLSAKWCRRDEMRQHATTISRLGHAVVSTWLQIDADTNPAQAARDDIDDLQASDAFIGFTEAPEGGYTTGGRLVELGWALRAGMPIVLVGPKENVFCHLPAIRFADSIEHAVELLSTRP